MSDAKDKKDDSDLLKELIGRLIACGLEHELTSSIDKEIKELEARRKRREAMFKRSC